MDKKTATLLALQGRSATWELDDGRHIILLRPSDLKLLEPGEVLTCIDGSTAIYGTDHIDDDTRGGFLAYGILT